MVAQWNDLRLETRTWPAGFETCLDYPIDAPVTPTLPDANLRYQEALYWRRWTNFERRMQLPSFVRAVLIVLARETWVRTLL